MDEKVHVLERIIRLAGIFMTDRDTAHRYLKFKFYFPEYYGKNLDALYDLLTEIGEPTKVIIYNVDVLKLNMPEYGRSMLKVFRAAEDSNPMLRVRFIEGHQSATREYKVKSRKIKSDLPDRPVE